MTSTPRNREIHEQLTQVTASLESVTSADTIEHVSDMLNRRAALEVLHERATAEEAAREALEREESERRAHLRRWIEHLLEEQRKGPGEVAWQTAKLNIAGFVAPGPGPQREAAKAGIALTQERLARGRKEIREFEQQHPEIVAELDGYTRLLLVPGYVRQSEKETAVVLTKKEGAI
jgi:hypothetical protein